MTNQEAIIELRDLKDYCNSTFMRRTCEAYTQAINRGIEALENQKIGHWIDNKVQTKLCNCSECDALSKVYAKYCPHCGAKMTEPQESENNE